VNRTAAALVDVEQVRPRVDALLTDYVASERALLTGFGADSAVLTDAVARMLSGGKRLRAAFCYWSFRAHGGEPGTPHADAVLGVGAALELFQAAALFHDDVMDDSDTRRGLPAAHRAFAERHRRSGWSGDPDRFGEAAAILLGDLTLIASEAQFSRATAGLPADIGTGARRVFDLMRTEVTAGQYLDVLAQALPWGEDPAGDEVRAREVIRAKSARYSVEHPLVLGAALAGADGDARHACTTFGLPLGEAFQLRDDLLGVFGDESLTGKPAGDDLVEGKRTVLVALALAELPQSDAKLLDSSLGTSLSEGDVAQLRSLIDGSGARAEVERRIEGLTERCLDALEDPAVAVEARDTLRSLALAATQRSV